MPQSFFVHIIDVFPRRRAELSAAISEIGLHPEIYDSTGEFFDSCFSQGPDGSERVLVQGVILISDDSSLPLADFVLELEGRGCTLPVLAFTMEQLNSRKMAEAYQGGVFDYFSYPTDKPLMLNALTAAVLVKSSKREAIGNAAEASNLMKKLTSREFEVMEMLSTGLNSKSIGRNLGISHRTVEVHRAGIIKKLKANSTAQAVAWFITSGMTARAA